MGKEKMMADGEKLESVLPTDEDAIAELRRLWCEGIESGPSEPLDMDEIKRKARARLGVGEVLDD